MIDLFVGKKSKEIETQEKKQGFSEMLSLKIIKKEEDFKILKSSDKQDYDACLIQTENIGRLNVFIDKARAIFQKVIVLGTDDEINRASLENRKTFGLLNPEIGREKDYMSYKNSGLNHVLCKIAAQNNKTIFISVDELRNPQSLGRVIQNLKLCKKFKVRCQLVNLADDLSIIRSAFELKEIERVLMKGEHFEHAQKSSIFGVPKT
jgi:RNase P/RNase MRP subunit p30